MSYRTEELRCIEPLPGSAPALIGALDGEGLIQAQVWIRLFAGEGRGADWEVAARPNLDWELLLPPSQHGRVIPWHWNQARAGLSWCISRRTGLAMIGLPTEEAWDRMLDAL
jgi:hypothetical protein